MEGRIGEVGLVFEATDGKAIVFIVAVQLQKRITIIQPPYQGTDTGTGVC